MKNKELIFATANINKIREVQAMLENIYSVKSSKDLGLEEDIPEDMDTLQGNASQKSHFLNDRFGCDCFADDTGLEVDALNGAPGVYSARYAGESKSSEENMDMLLKNMEGVENRKARFKTVISLIKEGEEMFFEGVVEGTIRREKCGADGFGYDPIFEPEGFSTTFAEMSSEQKNQLSHRGIAVRKLVDYLKTV